MEYAIFDLGRDTDVRKSVFKAPTVRIDVAAGEMTGFFYSLPKCVAALVGRWYWCCVFLNFGGLESIIS